MIFFELKTNMHKNLERITKTLSLKPKYNKVSWTGKKLYYMCFTGLHTTSHNYLPVYFIYYHIKELGSIKTVTRRPYFAPLIQLGILFCPSPSSELTFSLISYLCWAELSLWMFRFCIVLRKSWIWIHLHFGKEKFLKLKMLCLIMCRFKHGSPQYQFPYNRNYSSRWQETLTTLNHKTLDNNLKIDWLY